MSKRKKITLIVLGAILTAILIPFTIYFCVTTGYDLDENKLVDLNRGTIFYDANGELIDEQTNGVSVTDINEIPEHVINAFIAIEDKRFYSHNGTDFKALARAAFNNVKTFSFKQGASTISQQLIKNTHLSGEKTLKRKLIEMKLTKQLEKRYSKSEIMEKYLNTIYFGENSYGITRAAKTYFNKTPTQLNVNEAAILACVVKAPSQYSPFIDENKCYKRKNVVLNEMKNQGYITENDYERYKNEKVESDKKTENYYDYSYLLKKETREFNDKNAYSAKKFSVYTAYDKNIQNALLKNIEKLDGIDETFIVLNKSNEVVAFLSTTKEQKRNLASTVKPLLVYAPAIETNKVYLCSKIKDEKTRFGDYSPSNYGEVYYGEVSVKDALVKSLNVCAVKLLNQVGTEKALSYLKKTDVEVTENDDNLGIALGATEKGATLKEISAAYGILKSGGEYASPVCIRKITDEKNRDLYNVQRKRTKIFNTGTVNAINYALNECVKEGTAKKLSFSKVPLCAKTGTNGTAKGNKDAYCISYNNEYTLGVWYGNKDGNNLMSNSITGGTLPTEKAKKVWDKIYENDVIPTLDFSDGIRREYIDEISYEKDGKIILADDCSPERYKKLEIFTDKNVPKEKSDRFISPKIENANLLVNNNEVKVSLCLTELYEFIISREQDGKKEIIYDSKKHGKKYEYVDLNVDENKEYVYYVTPYFVNGTKVYYGDEVYIGKAKTNKKDIEQDKKSPPWWEDEFLR